MTDDDKPDTDNEHLVSLELDHKLARAPSADIEHERQVAVFDLIEQNVFSLPGKKCGPYRLMLSIVENRLVFDVRDEASQPCTIVGLSLSPFRRIVKDYFVVCDSYFQAIRTATPSQIETIDMARRGLHNEGSEILRERLAGKIDVDFDTARRLFTLVCVLHWRG